VTELCLAIDGASPFASAALAAPGAIVAEAASPARHGRSLLELVDDCFRASGRDFAAVGTVIAVCGPGSFTGLRVTLATAMGLVPRPSPVRLLGISSLAALALQAPPSSGDVIALVDALQGEWFHQRFTRSGELRVGAGPPSRSSAAGLDLANAVAVSFAEAAPAAERIAPAPLAGPVALAVADGRAGSLLEAALRPIYLRAPAVTPPRAAAS
jgi:tRNA threonylcarbamoyladenosine biosynthesis protein TsaB